MTHHYGNDYLKSDSLKADQRSRLLDRASVLLDLDSERSRVRASVFLGLDSDLESPESEAPEPELDDDEPELEEDEGDRR